MGEMCFLLVQKSVVQRRDGDVVYGNWKDCLARDHTLRALAETVPND